jgi:hypothetical protein
MGPGLSRQGNPGSLLVRFLLLISAEIAKRRW